MNRILPALVLIALWLLLLLKGSILLFWVAIVSLALVGGLEFTRMVCPGKGRPGLFCLSILISLPVLGAGTLDLYGLVGGLVLAFLLLAGYVLYDYHESEAGLQLLSRVSLGITYVGLLSAHLVLLRDLPQGNYWLLVLSAITAGSDSGAYYSGKLMGKRKLCPLVSPNKTVEGALGGLVAGVLVALVFAALFLPGVSWALIIMISVLLSGVGIVGDLVESVIKRATGTKDSGTFLAGHGGALDRVDSILCAAPVLYYLLLLMGLG